MTSPNNPIVGKRDLHVGGVGTRASAGLSTVVDPSGEALLFDALEPFLRKAREVARGADDYVHDHPWTALGVVALAGLAAGYLLSRRS